MIELRDRVRRGEPVAGTFVKTTSAQTVELLARTALDFVVLDAEHAPFGPESLAHCLAIAQLARLPALVRVPDHGPALINTCLDLGAAGILAPHVRSRADVEALADAVRYARGRRGFSPSTRAGGYGTTPGAAYRAAADAGLSLWCQIEDAEALDALDEIAGAGLADCLFIGPADLALSLGLEGPADPRLDPHLDRIVDAGRRHGRPVGIFVSRPDQIGPMLARGMSIIICGSDQSMVLDGAKSLGDALIGAHRKAG